MTRDGWTPASVGCHWTRGEYSISTYQCGVESGYALYRHGSGEVGRYGSFEEAAKAAACEICEIIRTEYGGFGPSHDGSARCESGSIASGGQIAHCSCDYVLLRLGGKSGKKEVSLMDDDDDFYWPVPWFPQE